LKYSTIFWLWIPKGHGNFSIPNRFLFNTSNASR